MESLKEEDCKVANGRFRRSVLVGSSKVVNGKEGLLSSGFEVLEPGFKVIGEKF